MMTSASLRILFDFPRQERISTLLHEAVKRIPRLASNYNTDIKLEFNKVQMLLDATPVARGQKSLLLGLARQHVARAEKCVVKEIVHNEFVTVDEMSDLVRVRLICAEISNLFTQSLEEFRAR
jgi:hypothetical protein